MEPPDAQVFGQTTTSIGVDWLTVDLTGVDCWYAREVK